jgi:hypothetical protein
MPRSGDRHQSRVEFGGRRMPPWGDEPDVRLDAGGETLEGRCSQRSGGLSS